MVSDAVRRTAQLRLGRRETSVQFDEVPEGVDAMTWLEMIMTDFLAYIMDFVGTDDCKVGVTIRSSTSPDKPIHVFFRLASQLTADVILDAIDHVIQSNDQFVLGTPLTFDVTYIRIPSGKAFNPRLMTIKDACRKKQSVIVISNNYDNMCLARAIVVGICKVNGDPDYEGIRPPTSDLQARKAYALCREAQVDLTNGGGLDEIRLFQNYLTDYKLTVFKSFDHKDNPLFEGPEGTEDHPRKFIDIIYDEVESHYNPIVSITGAFSRNYYCRPCHVGYQNKYEHKCSTACMRCRTTHDVVATLPVQCPDCKRRFFTGPCFDAHKTLRLYPKNRTMCDVVRFCILCRQGYNLTDKKTHVCYERFCSTCGEDKPKGHLCFIKAMPKMKPDKKDWLFVFFDLECTQSDPYKGDPSILEHKPNLCVVQQACSECVNNNDLTALCNACGVRQYVFKDDPLKQLFDYLRLPRITHKHLYCIAHNFKGYDGIFLLNYMITVLKWDPKVITVGTKIMSMQYHNLKFVDSLNFMPMSLSKLPKAMGLTGELKKGHFCHFMNTPANQHVVLPHMPDANLYGPDSMSASDRCAFYEWYNQQVAENAIFDFDKELEEYCVSDVTILRQACLKFRSLFISTASVDPFREAITIASTCMLVFRRLFLQANQIGIIPPHGYRLTDRQSVMALKWLTWEAKQRNVRINHAGNGKEVFVAGYRVDGYIGSTRTVIEVHGCYFHACPSCFKNNRMRKLHNASNECMNDRFVATEYKTAYLKSRGFEVVEVWECEIKEALKTSPLMREHFKDHALIAHEPLNARDAFYGGRTNCARLYHECAPDETIRYFDICSLYPHINYSGRYPVGHPVVYYGDECIKLVGNTNNIDNVHGLIKCTVLPPRKLFHPVLPMKGDGKLMFVLCRTCGFEQLQADCPHERPEERSLTGTWVTDEVRKAVSKGYTILKVHEIWHYKRMVQRNVATGEKGIFTDYVRTFLKIKQESSGYPAHVTTEDQKKAYIKDYKLKQGIDLDPVLIKPNDGLRLISKTCLVSIWGKYGQKDNLEQVSYVTDYDQLIMLICDPSIVVKTCIELSESMVYVCWKYNDDAVCSSKNTNVVIAAFTTALARLELYSYLEKIGVNALYYDTDSVIMVHRPGQYLPPTSDYLGDMTDELISYGAGSFIKTFISLGPKNYSLRVACGGDPERLKDICKVRGITLNYATQKVVNFDVMKRMLMEDPTPVVVDIPHKIGRLDRHHVVSRHQQKMYRMVVTKRRLCGDFNTLPYGYKN